MEEDYYKLLGVEKNATNAELKKAFRKKAQEFHPDKPDGDEAKFKAVNEAYSVLSDKTKRAQYDQFGKAGAQAGFGGAGGAGGFGGFDFSGFNQGGAGGFEFDLGDIFSQFGGGGFGGGGRRSRGQDISVSLTIDFKESVFGVEKEIELEKNSDCDNCAGTGAENKKTKTCPECSGSGRVMRVQNTIMGQVQTQATCPTCQGAGTVPEKNCHVCGGDGVRRKKEKITVKIPAGIEDGQQLRLRGRGEAIAYGQPGDLYIQIRVRPDRNFEKQGNHLLTNLDISLSEAALGATKSVKTINGSVKIKVPAGTETGAKLRVKGEGVQITDNRRGDLYVDIKVTVPKKLTREQKKLMEQLQKEGL